MTTLRVDKTATPKITGRMVLFGFIAFFGVITAVNGVFMYFALSTWPGLTSQNAYKEGIAYNQTLDAAAAQQKLGWRTSVALTESRILRVTLSAKDGTPIRNARVSLSLSRPLGDEKPLSGMLSETTPGTYEADFSAPLPGRWKADISARRGDDRYRMRHEVMVKS